MSDEGDDGARRLRSRVESADEGTLRLRAGVGSAVGESFLVVDDGDLCVVTRRSYLEPFEVLRDLEEPRVERTARGDVFLAERGGEVLRIELGYGEASAVEQFLAQAGLPNARGAARGARRREDLEHPTTRDADISGEEADGNRRARDEARIALLTLLDRPRLVLAWLEGRRAAGAQPSPTRWDEAVARARDAKRARPSGRAAVEPRRAPAPRTKRARGEPRPRAPERQDDVGLPPTSLEPNEASSDETSLAWIVGVIVAIVLGGLLLSAVLR